MVALGLILLCLLVAPASAFGSFTHESPARYVPGELLVRFAPGADSQARIASRRSTRVRFARRLPSPGLQLVRTAPGVSVGSAIAELERDPDVIYAAPNRYYH